MAPHRGAQTTETPNNFELSQMLPTVYCRMSHKGDGVVLYPKLCKVEKKVN